MYTCAVELFIWRISVFFVSSDFACMEPLGMESGEISSDQITASSQYNSNWSPERSRLNYQENGWTPSDDNMREWIQVSKFVLIFNCHSSFIIVMG